MALGRLIGRRQAGMSDAPVEGHRFHIRTAKFRMMEWNHGAVPQRVS
jgi:hypothetical protein